MIAMGGISNALNPTTHHNDGSWATSCCSGLVHPKCYRGIHRYWQIPADTCSSCPANPSTLGPTSCIGWNCHSSLRLREPLVDSASDGTGRVVPPLCRRRVRHTHLRGLRSASCSTWEEGCR